MPDLASDEVHVWRLALAEPTSPQEWDLLSADEQERASAFALAAHRDRFVRAHVSVRQILGRYLGVAPHTLDLHKSENGKPYLPFARIRFNLSRSHLLGLLAVALDREVGVDVERIRPVPDALAIAERWFAPSERSALAGLTERERSREFLRLWTCKEACAKASGVGLTEPLPPISRDCEPLALDDAHVGAVMTPGHGGRTVIVQGER